tara:strand:+ start:1421 stop:1939 length:519 start_codon:yes stop_codon:yes gene_type:complete
MIENNIKKLIKILEESNIDEIEISTFWGKQNIRVKKSSPPGMSRFQDVSKENIKNEDPDTINIDNELTLEGQDNNNRYKPKESIEKDSVVSENSITIKAPLVGTFYISPKPGEDPFIEVGKTINKGDIICIVEAMKIFNEIESEYDGKVIEILVKDGSPVEFDQPLMLISSD